MNPTNQSPFARPFSGTSRFTHPEPLRLPAPVLRRAPLPEQPRAVCPLARWAVLKALRPRGGSSRGWARLATGLLVVGFQLAVQAQLIIEENFNYPDGYIVGAPGSAWVNNYLPTNQITVTSGRLRLDQGQQESIRLDVPPFNTGERFASFKVNFTALPKGNGNYFAFFRANGVDALFCRVWAKTNAAAAGKFRLGITTISHEPAMIPADLSLGTTYTLVTRIALHGTNAISTLWIDPAAESDTTRQAEDQQASVGYVAGHFGFKQVNLGENQANGMGQLAVDELRIGHKFADVLASVRITRIAPVGGGNFELHGTGLPGSNYTVLAGINLNGAEWEQIGTVAAQPNGVIQFVYADAAKFSTRFYRLLQQ